MKVVLNQRLHIPKELVRPEHLKAYTHVIPHPIDGSAVSLEFFTESENYYSFCRGDLKKIFYLWPDLEITDERAAPRMKEKIKFLGELRPNQQEAVDKWMVDRFGCMEAPARFGKTCCLVHMICKMGLKTLVLTHQVDLLDQFYNTFYGNEKLKKAAMSNAGEVQNVGYVKEWEDIEKYDVCLLTYQRFVTGTNGKEMLKKYRDAFGLIVIDEAHKAAADCFSEVVGKFNPLYRIGVTATPNRKDLKHVVMQEVIGPVTAIGKAEQLDCIVKFVYTGYDPGDFQQWVTLENRLTKNEARNKLIVDMVVDRVMNGRNVLVITNRVDHTNLLTTMLRQRDIEAEAFNGRTIDRDGLLDRARNGKCNVVVAMRRMVLGIDVPLWDSFFNLLPSNNKPSYYQEFSRIRTPLPGKPIPEIFDFVDNHQACWSCKKTREGVYAEQGFQVQKSQHEKKRSSLRLW